MINRNRILLLLALLLVAVLTVSGCTRTVGVARGWSGATVVGDTLFFGSTRGKVVAVDISDGNLVQLGQPVMIEMISTGGGFACVPTTCAGPTTSAVAIYGSPVTRENLIYVGGYDGRIHALMFDGDRLRTEPQWMYPRQGDIGAPIIGGLALAHDRLYFASADGWVYALTAADGFQEWETNVTEDKIWSTPVIDGDTLYISSIDKKLYALSATDGTGKWHFETEGALASTPVVYDNKVYIGSFDRHIYALDTASGKQVWRFPANDEDENNPTSWFWAKPLVHNDVIYAPCLDGKVYALDAQTGNKIVDFNLGSPISSSPVLVGNLVVVATQDGTVYTLDTTNNRRSQLTSLGEKVTVYAPLFAHQGKVYLHSTDDTLWELDTESGARRKFTLTSE